MKLKGVFVTFSVLAAAVLIHANDAAACGGCFVQQTENTEVSGHRMVFSISQQQTTLWDQITYAGNPSEFAWVLPIRGQVDVGLSSDVLFQQLDQLTHVTINSPSLNCGQPSCNGATSGSGAGFSDGAGGGGVTIISEKVVGPYETVQLQSTNPQALETWLSSHGYALPADVKPVVDAYVTEGFDFLALRLIPGQDVSAMRPVRITMPGASPTLPLRMVAAGTGAVTPITLWIIGEGRYAPANMPTFTIDPTSLVWNWDTQSSNYNTVRDSAFADSGGSAWLVESTGPEGAYSFQNLVDQAFTDPTGSGYADAMGLHAVENAASDVDALLGGIPVNNLWVTRISSELSRAALASDLSIGASEDQSTVGNSFFVTKTTGKAPACPAPPQQPCGADFNGSGGDGTGPAGCEISGGATSEGESDSGFLLVGCAIVLGLSVGRRQRRSSR